MLSFCLGKEKSFLWAVNGDGVNLYQLPAEKEIAALATSFTKSVQSGRDAYASASSLSQSLFGQLSPGAWAKPDWLITADGALLSGVPFSALLDVSHPGHAQPLIANHDLRILPSELLLTSRMEAKPLNRFVGVADPIYNLADSRRARSATLLKTAERQPPAMLARLAGSDREIRAAAQQSGVADVQLLVGTDASGTALRKALGRTPEILHFAVHVVSPEGQPDQAALALSLNQENLPELLTREAVASYRVPGSLVVLSGCSSGQGRALPSAGLIGLSRAWLLAGATAVVVTSWPTADDSGRFFSVFYSHLQKIKTGSLASRASIALQETQLEMQRSNGDRSSAAYWAAYSIVSKE
ncbi:MAG: CHAT domain-containing protein [Acidobacteriaceae bacterium]|nr:CHAT domain-containing protein [Acidobacteriaceae bacterium]